MEEKKRSRESGLLEPWLLRFDDAEELSAQAERWFPNGQEKSARIKLKNTMQLLKTTNPWLYTEAERALYDYMMHDVNNLQNTMKAYEPTNKMVQYVAFHEVNRFALDMAIWVQVVNDRIIMVKAIIFPAHMILLRNQASRLMQRPHLSWLMRKVLSKMMTFHPTASLVLVTAHSAREEAWIRKYADSGFRYDETMLSGTSTTVDTATLAQKLEKPQQRMKLITRDAPLQKKLHHWFDGQKEQHSFDALRDMADNPPVAFAKEVDAALSYYSVTALTVLRTDVRGADDETLTRPDHFDALAYFETDTRALQAIILYGVMRKKGKLHAAWMAVASQGVLEDMRLNVARTRPTMNGLFHDSLCSLRKMMPELSWVSIDIETRGSQQVVERVFHPRVFGNTQKFAITNICSNCAEPGAHMAYEGVDGLAFCSERCAIIMWHHQGIAKRTSSF